MPQMLTLSNGRPETILSPKDFEDLIDKHMGMDCANYYQNQIEQLSELIRDLDSYVDDKDVHSTVKEVLKENMATNRKIGNSFETEFCELLFQHGFWCHNMAQNAAGQPADVIAVKNKTAYLIDCKVCSNNRFPLSRVEENQHFAMETWKACGNGEGWFALKVEDEIIMIPHFSMVALSYEKSTLNLTDIREYGTPLERWLKKC